MAFVKTLEECCTEGTGIRWALKNPDDVWDRVAHRCAVASTYWLADTFQAEMMNNFDKKDPEVWPVAADTTRLASKEELVALVTPSVDP